MPDPQTTKSHWELSMDRLVADHVHPCNCIGPQNGEPKCPCMMKDVIVRDGRYIQKEVDLGAAN